MPRPTLTAWVPALGLAGMLLAPAAAWATVEEAARGLIQREFPQYAAGIDVAALSAPAEAKDAAEVSTPPNGRLLIRGTSGLAIASALGWYLETVAHRQLSWDGDNLAPVAGWPALPQPVRITPAYRLRAYLNYCTFNYTMTWWDQARWEREIDWMALHGVNLPLATVGQEAVWQATLRRFGLDDDAIRQFLAGPAYSGWQWLTNIEAWGGPLPQTWIDRHLALGQFILRRERELGMQPILQGFSGCVPVSFVTRFPQAKILRKAIWCEVPPGTAQLDPTDPLFAEIGRAFLTEQSRQLGTGHFYAVDPFHEGTPPVEGGGYLNTVGKAIESLLTGFDPEATLVMQGWTIRKGIVDGITPGRLLVLDLTGDKWRETEAFWGRPWVMGVLHNFGGRTALGANLPKLAAQLAEVRGTAAGAHLAGVGAFPEAIEQNPIVYDLTFDRARTDRAVDLRPWVRTYVTARYGGDDADAQAAWDLLRESVYAQRDPAPAMETPLLARPALALDRASPWGNFDRDYPPEKVWRAWASLLAAQSRLGTVDPYQYDLVDVGRQALADLSLPLFAEFGAAFRSGDAARLVAAERRFLALGHDLDRLVGTRREFLLGRWLAQAKAWAAAPAEAVLYERNARELITVWGPNRPGAYLADYAGREWSGLIDGYYLRRWEQFFAFLSTQPPTYADDKLPRLFGLPSNVASPFYRQQTTWEYAWCEGQEGYAAAPSGDPVTTAQVVHDRWAPVMRQVYPGYRWTAPPP